MSLSDELRKQAQQSMGLSEKLRQAPQSTPSGVPQVQMPNLQQQQPAQQPPQTPQRPAHPYEEEVKFGSSLYPEVPAGMIKTIMGMESDTGKNATNKKADAGEYGYLSGITKTGAFGDMLKNAETVPYQVFKVMGDEAKKIASPKAAAAVTASIVAQIIRNKGVVPNNPEAAWKLYNEHYKTLAGATPTPQMKAKFLKLWEEFDES